MRLGAKILLTTSATFFAFLAVLYFISHGLLLDNFRDHEEKDTALNVERVLSALEGEIENLHSLNLDWASWDDSYSFVVDRNRQFIKSNLNTETLAKQRLNLVVFLNGSGKTVFAKALDHRSITELPMPQEFRDFVSPQGLFLGADPQAAGKSGVISLGKRFMMASARPITTSEGEGPVRGTLVMGRYLDEDEVKMLSEKTHLPASLGRYDGSLASRFTNGASRPLAGREHIVIIPATGDLIEGYALVKDLSGTPLMVLRVLLARDIYGQGKRSVLYFMVYLAAAALILVGSVLVFLKVDVLSRLSQLSRAAIDIGRTGRLSERVRVAGSDELTLLGGEINRMLGSLEELEAGRRKAEEEVRAAKAELEVRVRQRTAELVEKNMELRGEIAERKRVEEAMKEMVYHDYLTGLPNRLLFTDRLNQVLAKRHRTKDIVAAVLFVGIDRFKAVNDTLGHSAGDTLLKDIAKLFEAALREGDSVARVGGDEFAVLLADLARVEDIPAVVERIFDIFRKPVDVIGNSIFVTVSVGIAVWPYDGADSTALMKNADIAMYQAKGKGGNRYEMYNPEMAQKTLEKLRIGNRLRSALERNEFVLYYQPQYDLRKKRFTGAEALIRWRDREMGLVPPATFIPIAEETGLIVPIGEWVLRTACTLNRMLTENGLEDLMVSINISPRMFGEAGFIGTVASVLNDSGIDPRYLRLEITESLLMANLADAARTISELKSAGVTFSVDDFGTGYSSLAYLKNLSISELKIDRSFIKDIDRHADDKLITNAIISLAHSLNLEVIAEGVETKEQLDFLVEHNCDKIQGFYYARPLPEEEFMKVIMETNGKVG